MKVSKFKLIPHIAVWTAMTESSTLHTTLNVTNVSLKAKFKSGSINLYIKPAEKPSRMSIDFCLLSVNNQLHLLFCSSTELIWAFYFPKTIDLLFSHRFGLFPYVFWRFYHFSHGKPIQSLLALAMVLFPILPGVSAPGMLIGLHFVQWSRVNLILFTVILTTWETRSS